MNKLSKNGLIIKNPMACLQRQQSTIRMQSFPSHNLRIFVHHDYHYRENFIKAQYLAHDTFGIYQNTASYTFTLMKRIEAIQPVNVFITTVTLRIQAHAIPALPPALHHDLVAKVKTELCDIVLRVLTRGVQIVKFRLELNSNVLNISEKILILNQISND